MAYDGKRDAPALSNQPALMTLVSLNKQRMWVYGVDGLITQSRVSTGSSGYDTPKGIYNIIQKKEDHESNIYEGAPMPHMQRLLWTGIAMHGGEVPRHPASHGCIRLPWDFAETYFGLTKLSHRVVVTPNVRAPVRFDHPMLFRPLPEGDPKSARFTVSLVGPAEAATSRRTMAMVAAERAEEYARLVDADTAAKAGLATQQEVVVQATTNVALARERLFSARAELKSLSAAADKTRRVASSAERKIDERADRIRAKAYRLRADQLHRIMGEIAADRARISPLRDKALAAATSLVTVESAMEGYKRLLADAELRSIEARKTLEKRALVEADAARIIEDFRRAERNRSRPVSVLVSARTGRITLRQGFEPAGEGAVEIENATRPLGTYIFTALGWRDGSRTALDWNVVSVDEKGLVGAPRGSNRDAKELPPPTDPVKAQLALDRIRIPEEMISRIGEVVKPGSSLIISDYDMARSEVGKGTDFIVQMPEVVARVATKPKKKKNAQRTTRPNRNSWRVADRRPIRLAPVRYYYKQPPRGLFDYY